MGAASRRLPPIGARAFALEFVGRLHPRASTTDERRSPPTEAHFFGRKNSGLKRREPVEVERTAANCRPSNGAGRSHQPAQQFRPWQNAKRAKVEPRRGRMGRCPNWRLRLMRSSRPGGTRKRGPPTEKKRAPAAFSDQAHVKHRRQDGDRDCRRKRGRKTGAVSPEAEPRLALAVPGTGATSSIMLIFAIPLRSAKEWKQDVAMGPEILKPSRITFTTRTADRETAPRKAKR